MSRLTLSAVALLALSTAPLTAQDTFNSGVVISDFDFGQADLFVQDVSVLDGKVCIGNGCVNIETFDGLVAIKVKDTVTGILFDDTSTITFPDRDWRLLVNDDLNNASGGLERFAIKDETADVIPFTLMGGAPANALFVAADGNIGLGTSMPDSELHIVDGTFPKIALEQDGSAGRTPTKFNLIVDNNQFAIRDESNGQVPFLISSGASGNGALVVAGTGNVGLGTFTPDTRLHVSRADGTAQIKVEDTVATTSPRTLLNLQNNGRPEIVMGNTGTGGEWSFGAGTNFILKQGAVGSTSAAKAKLFEVEPNGNATLAGTLTTGGGTCGGGCDLVFSDDYDLPSITEHAEKMFALGHLPNVGPTIENQPINVSDKLGRMLNELEHAHIYIARQQAEITGLKSEHAARISALEAQIATLLARE